MGNFFFRTYGNIEDNALISKKYSVKNIRKTKLLLIVFLLSSFSFIFSGAVQRSEAPITLQWTSDSDWAREEEVFVRSFLEAYKNFSEEQLEITQGKEEWLRSGFKEERDEFKKGDGKVFLVSAKKNSKVVGFASFNETENKGEVYIRQLAVDPKYRKQGIGKKLVFSINKKIDGIQKYVFVTRRINIDAKNFYTKLGFKECEYDHEGLDPKKYVGYELAVKEKENL